MVIPRLVFGGLKTWSGAGHDGHWANPANWNGGRIPDSTDAVLLDHSVIPEFYQVILPDQAVVITEIRIAPGGGSPIELMLPASNRETNALRIRGPGSGLWLDAGAIFRNASGLSSGESLEIADSLRINNGANYIHQTRAAHANNILRRLSRSPGTERGVFEFDVPRASYTVSVSNRTYGSLVFSASAYGRAVHYTCTGSNPLTVAGDLRIGDSVSWSVNMSGTQGNIEVNGNFVQQVSVLDLASGDSNNTVLRIRGDLAQAPGALLTASASGGPCLELNGSRQQLVDLEGSLSGDLAFRLHNPAGCRLRFPLRLPWLFDLQQGSLISSADNLLSLAPACSVRVDSTQAQGPSVEGPLRKEGLAGSYFLFPVGREGQLRWLALKDVTGNFTVAYYHTDPAAIGTALGPGIDHISKKEYWTIAAESVPSPQAVLELSFSSPQSGGITDPAFLNVAGYHDGIWQNEGHAGYTGGIGFGSVISNSLDDFSGQAFTLASTANLENPLPLVRIAFDGHDEGGHAVFRWTTESPVEANHFDLLESAADSFRLLATIKAEPGNSRYGWSDKDPLKPGKNRYILNMVDASGQNYRSAPVIINFTDGPGLRLLFIPASLSSGENEVWLRAGAANRIVYQLLSSSGQKVRKGDLNLRAGEEIRLTTAGLVPGIYQFFGEDQRGKMYRLHFVL